MTPQIWRSVEESIIRWAAIGLEDYIDIKNTSNVTAVAL